MNTNERSPGSDGHRRQPVVFATEVGDAVKLTVVHEMDKPDSKFIGAVSSGWPHILASLKSLLETGESLEDGSWTIRNREELIAALAKCELRVKFSCCPVVLAARVRPPKALRRSEMLVMP